MSDEVRIVDVDASNVDVGRFFCYKSKPKTEGYKRKLAWLKERFAEGMRMKVLYEGKRSVGFVETIPGEYAWRPVRAEGYTFIHCIWVVGKGKGKGYGSRLLDICTQEAQAEGKRGMAMVTSSRVWLAGNELLVKNGFDIVDQAPPSFDLLVKRFDGAPDPAFPKDWAERQQRWGNGLTIFRSDQCPYIPDATQGILDFAEERDIACRVVELQSASDVQELAPSPYGTFSIVYKGELLSYHYLLPRDLEKMVGE